MKDKITIDGVDVSGCKSFCENYGEYYQGYWEDNEICYLHNNHCSDNKDCYYKQLLAEQAKNKKLVEALELALSDTCYDAETCEYKCQFAILNQCDLFKAGQALNEVNNAK